jgi:hypothetical protein
MIPRDGTASLSEMLKLLVFSVVQRRNELQKLLPLGCRSFDDLESEIGGFPLEIANL